jgi:hypothetical protein
MVEQHQEIITYRDLDFLLIGTPLTPFLKEIKDIKSKIVSGAIYLDYQAHWLLEDNMLYLIDLQCDYYTLKDLFQTDEPVFAEWFTGKLKFGFGDNHDDDWLDFYENHVWLNIEKGKIIDKKIEKSFNNDIFIEFGKYKGRNFNEVLYGKITNQDTKTTVSQFIDCLMSFISKKDFEFKVQSPYFKVDTEEVELIKKTRKYGVKYILNLNSVAIISKVFKEDDNAEKLSILLEKILSSNFANVMTLTKPTLAQDAAFAEESLLINPDVNYLIWALKTVDYFSINSIYLNSTFDIKKLKSLQIKRINETTFEYTPIFEFVFYKFSEYIQKINKDKFEKNNKVKYNDVYNIFTPDLSDKEMMSLYGFYLDESDDYLNNNELYDNDWYDNDSYRNNDNYYNSNNWLEDAAGSDDPEMMNDAYWNMD